MRSLVRAALCISLSSCAWQAAVDEYCLKSGHCSDAGPGGGAGGGAATGGSSAGGSAGGGSSTGGGTFGGGSTGGSGIGGGSTGGGPIGGGAAGGSAAGGGGAANGATQLAFLPATTHFLAGMCMPFTVELQDASGMPVNASGPLALSLFVPTGIPYSDAACAQQLAAPVIASGTSQLQFFATAYTGGTFLLDASAPGLADAKLSIVVNPVVRHGKAPLAAAMTSVDVLLDPPLLSTNALVFVQVLSGWADMASGRVSCRLNGLVTLTCARSKADDALTVDWQIVEHRALTVAHVPFTCNAGNATLSAPLTPPVVPASTFVTGTVQVESSGAFDANDYIAFYLLDAGAAALTIPCGTKPVFDGQVASMPGISVQRGTVMPFSGLTQTVAAAVPSGGMAVGYSYAQVSGNAPECAGMIRADVVDGGLSFSRGMAIASCGGADFGRLDWELIDFGRWATSQRITTAMTTGVTASTPVGPADPTLTLVITGSTSGFQGGGEDGDLTNAGGPADGIAVHELAPGDPALAVNVTRFGKGAQTQPGMWTAWVVTFTP